MSIAENLAQFKNTLGAEVKLVAVSKYSTVDEIQQAYEAGHRLFGENKVQDLCVKYDQLPKDISWQFIGHLQSNKVKYIAPFVSLIQACDSKKLLKEINKQAAKNERVISCLLQLKVAKEERKFGLDAVELKSILTDFEFEHVKIVGLMAMATNTPDESIVQAEFAEAKQVFEEIKTMDLGSHVDMQILSMGMSQDYMLAIEQGSNMLRVGSAIFKI